MREKFIDKNFSSASITTLAIATKIIKEYQRQGYDLSLRQLYYQLVARDYIENTIQSYKRLGNLINDGRLTGDIDWNVIVDRNRETLSNPHWSSPKSILLAAARSFAIDKWEDQPNHIEVMVEKAALEGVLRPVCSQLDIRFTANRGYASSSLMYEVGKRLEEAISDGKEPYIIYLGDHDPSGIDMTRDIEERLAMFSYYPVEVIRVALNLDQIEQYQPPENPAKTTDSRYKSYIIHYGESSWELDALEPSVLADLVSDQVISLRDADAWAESVERENKMKQDLKNMADSYADS